MPGPGRVKQCSPDPALIPLLLHEPKLRTTARYGPHLAAYTKASTQGASY